MNDLWWVGAVAALMSGGVLALARPLLARHALDVPVDRSSHDTPVPRAGGVGVVAGVMVAAGVAWMAGIEPVGLVLGALVAMAVVGLVEDVRGLPLGVRLAAQVVVSVVVVVVIGQASLGPALLLPVICVALVGYCNAFNFMDGIDGISGLTLLVVAGWYGSVGHAVGASAVTVTCALLAGAVLGFLPWNIPTARLFLGDTGSYALGMAIPVLGLVLRAEGASWPAVLAPLLVYLADTGWTLGARLRRREAWHEAHRDHVYQRLAPDLRHLRTAALVAALTALSCGVWWVMSPHVWAAVAGWAALLLAYLSMPQWWPRLTQRPAD